MILQQIVEHKRAEVAVLKATRPLRQRKYSDQGTGSFRKALAKPGVSLIAEVKRASPTKGVFLPHFDPVQLARGFAGAGAAALSILTETKYFLGSMEYVKQIKEAVSIPVLRKDFIIDPYQIYETRELGADALLLITALLTEQQLQDYLALSRDLGLEALVEVHSREELATAVHCGAEIIGINNRNLKTFRTDIATTLSWAHLVPETCLLVSESGIATAQQVRQLAEVGVQAILVGESLVTSADIEGKVRELAGVKQGDLG